MEFVFLQIIVSFIGVVAFAVLFGTPWRLCISCGITGTLAWVTYIVLYNSGVSIVVSTAAATMLLTIVGRIFSVMRQVPATTFLVTGIFPLVPGAGLYYTAYYMIMDNTAMASQKGVETFKIALAIAIGLSIGAAIPQKWFNSLRQGIMTVKHKLHKPKPAD